MAKIENKPNYLYFFTASFPYGKDETFIETEILYLAKKFQKIIIVSHDVTSKLKRVVPKNVKVIRIRYNLKRYEKLFAINQLFSKFFWEELQLIKSNRSLTIGIIKTLIVSLFNAKRLSNEYLKLNENKQSIFYSYWMNDSSIALSVLKSKYQFHAVAKMHRWDIYFEENKYNYLPLRSYLVENLDCIYSISMDGINYAKNNLNLNVQNFKLSRLGINRQIDNLQTINNKKIIVSCSNVIKIKRVDLIAKAIQKLNINDLTWVHFGDGLFLNELKCFCDTYLKGKIKYFFKGRVSNAEVLDFYRTNNPSLFINVSSSEGVPVSIMEAMSYGIPVIATDVGGNSEIVTNENGYLLEPSPTVDNIKKKINDYFLLSDEEKDKKRLSSYSTWNNSYNAKKNYTEFCQSLISRN